MYDIKGDHERDMTIEFGIKLQPNSQLIKDIEELINKHKDDIENVTTQYVSSSGITLWQVGIQFHPVSVSIKDKLE